MPKEIKFRGKCIYPGRNGVEIFNKFIYGDLHKRMNEWLIYCNDLWFEVDKETVGQYTGLKDKNGKEIYEGDIVQQTYHKQIGYGDCEENFEGYHVGEVVLISSGVCIKKPLMYEYGIGQFVKLNGYKNVAGYRSKVIGNIYENPELLEGDSQ